MDVPLEDQDRHIFFDSTFPSLPSIRLASMNAEQIDSDLKYARLFKRRSVWRTRFFIFAHNGDKAKALAARQKWFEYDQLILDRTMFDKADGVTAPAIGCYST